MLRVVLMMTAVVLLSATLSISADNSANYAPAGVKGMSFHETGVPKPAAPGAEPGLANAIKKSKLVDFPAKTIGEAFDGYRYFNKREWRETAADGGKYYVDFIGWFNPERQNIISMFRGDMKGVDIKFLVHLDGRYAAVMASRIEKKSDGKTYTYPLENLNEILGKLYANKKISW